MPVPGWPVPRRQQLTLLIGKHFGNIRMPVEKYLPKPVIDPLTIRMSELMEQRGKTKGKEPGEDGDVL